MTPYLNLDKKYKKFKILIPFIFLFMLILGIFFMIGFLSFSIFMIIFLFFYNLLNSIFISPLIKVILYIYKIKINKIKKII